MSKLSTPEAVLPNTTTHSGLGKEGTHVHHAMQASVSDEIIYKYLIDLRLDLNDRSKYLPRISQFPPSVQVYLRLLGRTEAVQAMADELSPDRISQSELAGGWRLLRLGRYPEAGQKPRGVYVDESRITPQAIAQCPMMPWLYNASRDDYSEQMSGHTQLGDSDEPDNSPAYCNRDPYITAAQSVWMSNVIIPLPDTWLNPGDEKYSDLVRQCYSHGHPIIILDNHWDLDYNNDERLFMVYLERAIDRNLLLDPDDERGVNKERDAAFEVYWDEIVGI